MLPEDLSFFTPELRKKVAQLAAVCFFIAGVASVGYGFWVLTTAQQAYGTEAAVVCPVTELSESSPQPSSESGESSEMLTVAIRGGVHKPGMYQVPARSRVGDVVVAAGGLSNQAEPLYVERSLNLAQPLKDGEGIYIPLVQDSELETVCTAFANFTTAASSTQNSTTTSTEQSQQTSTKTSVNTASEKQLTSLPGIGEVRAAAIVAGRPYTSFEELVTKEVLTQKLFDGLADLIEL